MVLSISGCQYPRTMYSRSFLFRRLNRSQLKIVARGDADIDTVLDLVRSESTSDFYLYGHETIDKRYPKHTQYGNFDG